MVAVVLEAAAVVAVVALAVRFPAVRPVLRGLAWGLLRLAWGLTRRAALLAGAALLFVTCLAFPALRRLAWQMTLMATGIALSKGVGGGRESGHRTPDSAAPRVKLKTESAQRIATASYAETRFFATALEGPALLSMCVGPAGVGKSELAVFAATRAAFDGGTLCGLATTKPRRTLLLSEMGGATLQPALRRWKFYAEAAGWGELVRLRLRPPRGYAGDAIDVVFAADVYRPVLVDGEWRMAEWPAVIEAVRPVLERRKYDRIIVDSLGEWLGSDGNDSMLKTLGACRQLTHAGAGVTLLHHTPRSDPYRPRGGTVIEAKLDIGWSVTGFGPGGMPRSREDPAREVRWFKTRFPDHTPPGTLTVERAWTGPLPDGLPVYRPLATVAGGTERGAAAAPSATPTPPALTAQASAVLAAFVDAGPAGATVSDVAKATGIARQRVNEAVNALVGVERLRAAGTVRRARGGTAPARYAAGPPDPAAADRLLREALDATDA